MENYIYNLMQQINGYPQWCIYMFTYISGWIQVIFPPYPGEVILVLNGCIQSEKPLLLSLTHFFAYWLSIISANFLLYELGSRKGVTLLQYPFVSKYLSVKNSAKIKGWIQKYGFLIYLTAIYIPGMYLPLVFFSGVIKYKRRNALIGIMMATLVHDIILFLGGRVVGNNLQSIVSFISTYRNIALCFAIGAIVIFVLFLFLRNKKQATDADIA